MLIVARPTVLAGSREPSKPSAPRVDAARIGPNAIIQVARVLSERFGDDVAEALLREHTSYSLATLPQHMVPEDEPLALTCGVLSRFGEARATLLLHEAGQRTGDYLMAHRIPRFAQRLIRLLPRRAGLAVLLKSMRAHAWTFAGSGTFSVHTPAHGAPLEVELRFHACAMCRGVSTDGPVCAFYAGTFERLVTALVSRTARVLEVECQAQGGSCCRFVICGLS
jgi:divinyl protochlorophyllide a 8-vinyl-reductase